MTSNTFDDLAFTIERALRGTSNQHLRRSEPNLSELEAHAASMEVAHFLRERWKVERRKRMLGTSTARLCQGPTVSRNSREQDS